MKKAIEISVLRVSSNGKYIEFIINCPEDYYFTDFTVEVYGGDDKYSLKDCLFTVPEDYEGEDPWVLDEDGNKYWNKHYYSGQFKLEDIEVTEPEMFKISLEVHHNESADSDIENNMETNECWNPDPIINETVYISDVSHVYSCLMDSILKLGTDVCGDSDIQDEVIRNYLILYAHQEAMKLRELSDAKKYFSILKKCFSNCGAHKGCSTCGANYPTYKPNNCGCK